MKYYLFTGAMFFLLACANSSRNEIAQYDSAFPDKTYQASDTPLHHEDVLKNVTESGDTSFIVKAIKSNQKQIRMADLAEKKSSDSSIKRIASNLRTDNQVLLRDLYSFYESRDSAVMATPKSEKVANDSILANRTNELSSEMQELDKLDGKKFDKEWVKIMIENQERAIDEYEKELVGNKDKKLEEMITKAISRTKEHKEQLLSWKGSS
jgi:predicted outer membrane protein